MVMKKSLLAAAALATAIAMPMAAQAQSSGGAAAGATAGAVGGAVVGGPVGAVVGGATGAVVGGLTGPEETKFKEYVVREHRPSVRVQEKVVVGETLPSSVQFYEVPETVGVKTKYRYSVVNDRTVLVDPSTRRVVQVID